MTASSTRCSRNSPADAVSRAAEVLWRRWVLWGLRWVLFVLLALCGQAQAANPAAIPDMRLEQTDEGLFLTAVLEFELPTLAEDALRKGIPMYFVTEAELTRRRWYWYDQHIATEVRYLRLSYQPLTRRWRLNVSSEPFDSSGLGVALGQNFDDLADVRAAMQRIVRWKIAPAAAIDPQEQYQVQLRFRLDLSQLPRPLQIGALGRSGWNLSLARSLRWSPEPTQ